jgi:phosphoribosylglycinamide formyltransferase-1
MRITIIGSSGGSAPAEVIRACPHVGFRVITDRECGLETRCRELGVPHERIVEPDNSRFSALAAQSIAASGGAEFVLLFFTRLVTEPLLGSVPVLNIHPSLLPAFPGMKGVRQAYEAGCRFLGATLHVADPGADTGPIIAQACQAIDPAWDLAALQKRSFLHKIALALLAIDLREAGKLRFESGKPVLPRGLRAGDRLNPALRHRAHLDFLRALQKREGAEFL